MKGIVKMKNCIYCGAENLYAAKFCVVCGANQVNTQDAPSVPQTPSAPQVPSQTTGEQSGAFGLSVAIQIAMTVLMFFNFLSFELAGFEVGTLNVFGLLGKKGALFWCGLVFLLFIVVSIINLIRGIGKGDTDGFGDGVIYLIIVFVTYMFAKGDIGTLKVLWPVYVIGGLTVLDLIIALSTGRWSK